MPYFHRCDKCNVEVEFWGFMNAPEELSCEDCGFDACEMCIQNGVCSECQDERDKQLALDILEESE